MLSVGRELYIQDQPVFCLECEWEGLGAQLSTGHLRASESAIYIYAYRCALCGSFNVRRKARILAFRPSPKSEELEDQQGLMRTRI